MPDMTPARRRARQLIGIALCPIWLWTLTYIGVALWLWADDDKERPTDPYVLLLTGIAVVLILGTLTFPLRPWTTRRVGLLYLLGAFGLFSLASYALTEFASLRGSVEALNILILAGLLVGSVAGITGVARYAWAWWCHTRHEDDGEPLQVRE